MGTLVWPHLWEVCRALSCNNLEILSSVTWIIVGSVAAPHKFCNVIQTILINPMIEDSPCQFYTSLEDRIGIVHIIGKWLPNHPQAFPAVCHGGSLQHETCLLALFLKNGYILQGCCYYPQRVRLVVENESNLKVHLLLFITWKMFGINGLLFFICGTDNPYIMFAKVWFCK